MTRWLLISTAKYLMQDGVERQDALVQAVGIRLRPVTMTTLTTVLALTPLLFGGGEGAVLRQPMALTIIGGIVTATIGSLLVFALSSTRCLITSPTRSPARLHRLVQLNRNPLPPSTRRQTQKL